MGYHEDLRHSQEHVEEAQFAVNPTGTLALWRRSKVTFLGIGEDDKAAVTPPALDHPADMTVGRKWGSTYVNGKTTVTYHGEVLSKGSVTLDGHAVPTYLLRTDSTFDGPIHGTRRDISLRPFASSRSPVNWKHHPGDGRRRRLLDQGRAPARERDPDHLTVRSTDGPGALCPAGTSPDTQRRGTTRSWPARCPAGGRRGVAGERRPDRSSCPRSSTGS